MSPRIPGTNRHVPGRYRFRRAGNRVQLAIKDKEGKEHTLGYYDSMWHAERAAKAHAEMSGSESGSGRAG